MSKIPKDIQLAHRLDENYATKIRKSDMCGCYYCLHTFKPDQIKEWLFSARDDDTKLEFCMCPYCEIDAVLGDASGYPISEKFLREMNKYWFGGKVFSIH